MRIERFAADDMSGAMRIVKARLGPNAVILDNDRIGDKVEVLAAADYDETLLDKIPKLSDRIEISPEVKPAFELGAIELHNELRDLKSSLTDELTAIRQHRQSDASSARTVVARRLAHLGFSDDVIKSLTRRISARASGKPSWKATMKLLGSVLLTGEDEILCQGGVVALLGATGVGKTTTAAKLAAQFAFRHGKDQVALITTDSFRIGSHEQLSSYARALGIPMEVACNKQELARKVEEYKDRKLVLIDTAGMGQRDIHLAQHLMNIIGGAPRLKGYLVLSSTSQMGLVHEVTRAFGKIPLKAAIVTKTDEAISMGPVLSGVIRAKLPVAYLCTGQSVPEDIELADRRKLLELTRSLVGENPSLSGLANYRGELHG